MRRAGQTGDLQLRALGHERAHAFAQCTADYRQRIRGVDGQAFQRADRPAIAQMDITVPMFLSAMPLA